MASSRNMNSEARDILNCYQACTETIQHCLTMGGDHTEAAHLSLMLDCAKICEVTAYFLMRNSKYAPQLAKICAEICEACAASCEELDGDEMKQCAEACRHCAKICRAIK